MLNKEELSRCTVSADRKNLYDSTDLAAFDSIELT